MAVAFHLRFKNWTEYKGEKDIEEFICSCPKAREILSKYPYKRFLELICRKGDYLKEESLKKYEIVKPLYDGSEVIPWCFFSEKLNMEADCIGIEQVLDKENLNIFRNCLGEYIKKGIESSSEKSKKAKETTDPEESVKKEEKKEKLKKLYSKLNNNFKVRELETNGDDCKLLTELFAEFPLKKLSEENETLKAEINSLNTVIANLRENARLDREDIDSREEIISDLKNDISELKNQMYDAEDLKKEIVPVFVSAIVELEEKLVDIQISDKNKKSKIKECKNIITELRDNMGPMLAIDYLENSEADQDEKNILGKKVTFNDDYHELLFNSDNEKIQDVLVYARGFQKTDGTLIKKTKVKEIKNTGDDGNPGEKTKARKLKDNSDKETFCEQKQVRKITNNSKKSEVKKNERSI